MIAHVIPYRLIAARSSHPTPSTGDPDDGYHRVGAVLHAPCRADEPQNVRRLVVLLAQTLCNSFEALPDFLHSLAAVMDDVRDTVSRIHAMPSPQMREEPLRNPHRRPPFLGLGLIAATAIEDTPLDIDPS